MTNMQFYFALGVPFFTVVLMYLISAISNRSAVNDLGKHIDDLRADMRAGFTDIHRRMDRFEKRLDLIDTEIRINHQSLIDAYYLALLLITFIFAKIVAKHLWMVQPFSTNQSGRGDPGNSEGILQDICLK